MANLILEVPDELARSLEGLAAAQHRSVQELAVEGLRSFVDTNVEHPAGSPAAVLDAMRQSPHLSASDVAELEAAIKAGRMPVGAHDPLSE